MVKKKTRQSQKRFASKTEKWLLPLILVSFVVITGITIILLTRASVSPGSTYISSIADLGEFSQPPNFVGRDGGHSALLGGKVTWIFGDTIYSPKGISKMTGDFFRSATAAIGNTTNPTQVTEPLDGNSAPYQLIPYTPEELAYNKAKSMGNDRYATWPGSIVTEPNDSYAYIYYLNLHITPSKWENQGVGIATITPGSTVAQKKVSVLFGPNEPSFRRALRVGNYMYVYAECAQKFCPVSRVPFDQATNRSAYTFWNGTAWVADVNQAKSVLPSSNLGSAVMYNRALKSYVSANIQNYTHSIYFSYAPAPEGPWTTPIKAIDMPTTKQEYTPSFHPELSSDNDKTVFLSYGGVGRGVRLLKLTLNPPVDGVITTTPTNTIPGTKPTDNPTNQKSSQKSSQGHSSGSTSSANPTSTSSDIAQSTTQVSPLASVSPTNRLDNDSQNPEQKNWWQQILDFFANLFNRN